MVKIMEVRNFNRPKWGTDVDDDEMEEEVEG